MCPLLLQTGPRMTVDMPLHTLLEELLLYQPRSLHSPLSIGEPNLCLPTGQTKGPAQEGGGGFRNVLVELSRT